MKRISTLFLLLLVFLAKDGLAQDDELKIKIGGFVRYEAHYDDYKSVVSRDGELYLYPKPQDLDALGNDINEAPVLNMLTVMTRFNIKVSGPEIWGAKSSSLIEADFFGTSQAAVRLLRLRHAYMKLNWEKAELLMGHSWHPMFVAQCYPANLTMAAGVPFNPLNRSAQIKTTLSLTEDLTVVGSLHTHTYHKSVGPADAQRNSGLPDFQFQARYAPGDFLVGFTAGYKFLTPRLSTEDGLKTSETIGSYNLQGFMKYAKSKFSIKAMGVLGENLTNFVSIGGYGAAQDPSVVDNYNYSNMKTFTCWTDITLLENPQIGLFAGYAENLGADGDYYQIGSGRAENLDKTYRISPRITYKIKNLTLGFEVQHAVAVYGETFDAHFKAITTATPTSSNRILFATKYSF